MRACSLVHVMIHYWTVCTYVFTCTRNDTLLDCTNQAKYVALDANLVKYDL